MPIERTGVVFHDPNNSKDYKGYVTANEYDVKVEIKYGDEEYEFVIEVFDGELIVRHYRKGTDEPLGIEHIATNSRSEEKGEGVSSPKTPDDEPTYLDL